MRGSSLLEKGSIPDQSFILNRSFHSPLLPIIKLDRLCYQRSTVDIYRVICVQYLMARGAPCIAQTRNPHFRPSPFRYRLKIKHLFNLQYILILVNWTSQQIAVFRTLPQRDCRNTKQIFHTTGTPGTPIYYFSSFTWSPDLFVKALFTYPHFKNTMFTSIPTVPQHLFCVLSKNL